MRKLPLYPSTRILVEYICLIIRRFWVKTFFFFLVIWVKTLRDLVCKFQQTFQPSKNIKFTSFIISPLTYSGKKFFFTSYPQQKLTLIMIIIMLNKTIKNKEENKETSKEKFIVSQRNPQKYHAFYFAQDRVSTRVCTVDSLVTHPCAEA